jgi:hypothetical protein
MLRQSVFGRLAGYEDVNDAERLRYNPAIRWIVGGKAVSGCAASASQMGRFETRWLAVEKNLSALADLSGQWIDKVHGRRPPKGVVLGLDSSVRAFCIWLYPYPAFLRYAAHSAGGYWARILALASEIAS